VLLADNERESNQITFVLVGASNDADVDFDNGHRVFKERRKKLR